MGFYLRKSVRAGPFRVNFSKSGVGISAGIRGMRLGTGPRGNYVHVGANGLYYRASVPGVSATPRAGLGSPPKPRPTPRPTGDTLDEIESGSVQKMRDSSSEDLLNELNGKQHTTQLMPWFACASVVAVLWLHLYGGPSWSVVALGVVLAIATFAVRLWDETRKTTVLFYDLDPEAERRFQSLHDGFAALAASSAAWHAEAKGEIRDQKRNAGATSVVRHRSISPKPATPAWLKTNVATPALSAGRQTLYFFPDRILVFDRSQVGAIGYADLEVERRPSRFIEEGRVPRDATVVDRTWRYVNKKGGPDRRFKDNKELPVLLYENVHLTSASGLNELFSFSKADSAAVFERALAELARGTRTP